VSFNRTSPSSYSIRAELFFGHLPGGISYGYNDRSRKENTEPPQQVKTAKYFQEALVGCQERADHLDRLIREYLRRVAHNVEAIHLWIAGEYELIKDKDRSSYSEKDALVLEALQLAIDLRVYSLVACAKVWFWTVFRMYRWPALLFPTVTDLRVQCGVNVLAKYRRLTENSGSAKPNARQDVPRQTARSALSLLA